MALILDVELIAQVFAQENVMVVVEVIALLDVIMHVLRRAQVALLMQDQMGLQVEELVQIMLEVIVMALA